ncbi:65-kDa microtubule-associated protein 6 [Apostasia shenzhenica]|uniref:65-kDa microtubule-associated protein 6 n=1 Tax=Apostasia shenzhenica TaxID=1088818 RepID=A0A2I0AEF4_9ASPA|nr:65-kDa microtubule-associated protein 6 [Apostasia shenzhenica]
MAVGVEERSFASFSMEGSCGALLRELQLIWDEIGESKSDQDQMLSEIDKECLKVYQRKLEQASTKKARIYQLVASSEAELAALMASLGEHNLCSQMEKKLPSLKEQLASITPILEDLRAEKEERIKLFSDIKSQILKITAEMTENYQTNTVSYDEFDISMKKLNEYQTELRSLQKEKMKILQSDRLRKILNHTNEIHHLCGVLGLDFRKTVAEVHPSLHETSSGQLTNISNKTLESLSEAIIKLKEEKKFRTHKLREAVKFLVELWKLMESSEDQKKRFRKVTCMLDLPDEEITQSGLLSLDIIKQIQNEVERLKILKASKIKELLLKRRLELEEVCRRAHIEIDMSTGHEKTISLIDSGLVDLSELLVKIEAQISKARHEFVSRREIIDKIDRLLAACEEENWLEEYNLDQNRYNAGKGVHLNLKRAEQARVTIRKIPAIVDNLILKTFAWEDQRNMPFLYDGVHLISVLEDYKLTRQQNEETRRRYREHKKMQSLLGKETMYASRTITKRSSSFNRKPMGHHLNGNGNGFMTPAPQQPTLGSATPELLSPCSYSSHYSKYFNDIRMLSTRRLIFVSKEDTSSSFASINGSDPESPPVV